MVFQVLRKERSGANENLNHGSSPPDLVLWAEETGVRRSSAVLLDRLISLIHIDGNIYENPRDLLFADLCMRNIEHRVCF